MSRILPFVFVGALLVAWEAVARSGAWSPLLFPSLAKIFDQLVFFFSRPAMLGEALVSLERALGGFALAAAAGIALGVVMGRSPLVAALLDPLFSGTYAVPKLALFQIFIAPVTDSDPDETVNVPIAPEVVSLPPTNAAAALTLLLPRRSAG